MQPGTERQNVVATLSTLLPAWRLRQACEEWTRFADIIDSYDDLERSAPTFNRLASKASFRIKYERDHDSCCVFCSTVMGVLAKYRRIRGFNGKRPLLMEVGVDAFDEICVRAGVYRVFVPRGGFN
jgi:hypothetical protein